MRRTALAVTSACMLVLAPLAAHAANVVPESETDRAAFVLQRLGFGPTGDQVSQVAQMGVSNYIAQQLHPEKIPLPPSLSQQLAALPAIHASPLQLLLNEKQLQRARKEAKGEDDGPEKKRLGFQLQAPALQAREAKLLREIESPRQLEEALADFWGNHFNVYAEKDADRVFIASYEDLAIRPYVLGRFRDMLEATAKHPAMLYYLDNWKNVAPDTAPAAPGAKPRQPSKNDQGINENYAREVMELHTLGVNGGYGQNDVTQLAHVLTGWGFGGAQLPKRLKGTVIQTGPTDAEREMVDAQNNSIFFFNPDHHDYGTKVFLGQQIGGMGQAEGEHALDMLAYSPTTAKHLSYELAQYFVADDPPASLVARMEGTWQRTGGDLRAVTATMINSQEFWDPKYRGAKYRTPLQYMVGAVRASGAPIDLTVLTQQLKKLGEEPFGCLTPDGYKNTQDAWLNSSGTEERLAFASLLGAGKLSQIHIVLGPDGLPRHEDTQGKPQPLDAYRISATLGPILSPNTIAAINAADPAARAALLLGSPEMMRR